MHLLIHTGQKNREKKTQCMDFGSCSFFFKQNISNESAFASIFCWKKEKFVTLSPEFHSNILIYNIKKFIKLGELS